MIVKATRTERVVRQPSQRPPLVRSARDPRTLSAPTYSELMVEVAAGRVRQYRELIRRAAAGWTLTRNDGEEVSRLLLQLELPAWSFPRDVAAARAFWEAATEHRMQELAWLHPHLFADPHTWAKARRGEREKRRRVLRDIGRAVAEGK